jgi:hypothetical protein
VRHTCQVCGTALQQPATGRPKRYCSRKCKRRAERLRAKASARFRPRRRSVSPELSAAEDRVRKTEQRLAEARAQRAELDDPQADPEPPHTFTTYEGSEWLAQRCGLGFTVGIDVTEAAARIEREYRPPDPTP